MPELPKRKPIRIKDYDYSTPGAYFITVCSANREKIFWDDRRGDSRIDRYSNKRRKLPVHINSASTGSFIYCMVSCYLLILKYSRWRFYTVAPNESKHLSARPSDRARSDCIAAVSYRDILLSAAATSRDLL